MTLYHWSVSPIECFIANDVVMNSKTQGHIYAVSQINTSRALTKSFEARSMIVFTEQAEKLFCKHPLFSVLFFKRLQGQYWSRIFLKDIAWSRCDTSSFGRVIVVRKARLVKISEPSRRFNLLCARFAVIAMDVFMFTFVMGAILLAANPDQWLMEYIQSMLDSIDMLALQGAMIVAVFVIIFFSFAGRVRRAPNEDGSDWDLPRELRTALERSRRRQL